MGQPIRLRDVAITRAERERDRTVALAARGSAYAIQPTIQRIVEQFIALGDRAGALAAVRAVAAAHMTDDNPGAAAQALYFGWVETRETDLLHEGDAIRCACDRPAPRTFAERLDVHEIAKLVRCTLRWRHGDASFVGTLECTAPIAASWLASCTFALVVDGTSAPILCACDVLRATPQRLMVRCVPTDLTAPRAFLRQRIQTNVTGTATNLQSVIITPPTAPPRRVENTAYAPLDAAMRG